MKAQSLKWWYAVKPKSWPKILVPALLGQALGVVMAGGLSWGAFAVGAAFTLADLIYIVLLNDWGDREVDAIKREMFPDGCSPKTIPDGILPAQAVLWAGVGAGLVALVVAGVGTILLDRPALIPLALTSVAVFFGYTFAPLKLNYRGGGELLEMVGVGALMPWVNAYIQSGELFHPVLWLLPGLVAFSLASALASGLSDEESDRAGGKRTFTTAFGNPRVRRAVEILVVVGAVAWLLATVLQLARVPWWTVIPPIVVVAWHVRSLFAVSHEAVTNAFEAQARYKNHLHRAIWDGTVVLAGLLVLTLVAK